MGAPLKTEYACGSACEGRETQAAEDACSRLLISSGRFPTGDFHHRASRTVSAGSWVPVLPLGTWSTRPRAEVSCLRSRNSKMTPVKLPEPPGPNRHHRAHTLAKGFLQGTCDCPFHRILVAEYEEQWGPGSQGLRPGRPCHPGVLLSQIKSRMHDASPFNQHPPSALWLQTPPSRCLKILCHSAHTHTCLPSVCLLTCLPTYPSSKHSHREVIGAEGREQ